MQMEGYRDPIGKYTENGRGRERYSDIYRERLGKA